MKGQPGEDVIVNDSGLYTGRVFHMGVYDKQVIVPPRSDFSRTGTFLHFKVNTLAGQVAIHKPYMYLGTRYLIPDAATETKLEQLSQKICRVKSPFRIGASVPTNAVNIGFITTPEYSVDGNLSFIDGGDTNSENFANSFKDYRMLSAVTGSQQTGAALFVYTGQIETNDVVLTNHVMIRESVDFAAPLFFAHNIGGEELYLHQTGGTNNPTGDLELIRSNIKLSSSEGTEIKLEEYPWDIRVSKNKSDGKVLPNNVFNVDLLTRDRLIQGTTVFVVYVASDPVQNYKPILSHIEVVNPETIWKHVGKPPAAGELFQTKHKYQTTDIGDAEYNPGPNLVVRHVLKDGWDPSTHDGISEEDVIHVDDIALE